MVNTKDAASDLASAVVRAVLERVEETLYHKALKEFERLDSLGSGDKLRFSYTVEITAESVARFLLNPDRPLMFVDVDDREYYI